MSRLYAITYDIPSDNRRVKIANVLKSYGERVQYSVFECWLSKSELEEAQTRLEKILKASEDSIRFYPSERTIGILGLGSPSTEADILII